MGINIEIANLIFDYRHSLLESRVDICDIGSQELVIGKDEDEFLNTNNFDLSFFKNQRSTKYLYDFMECNSYTSIDMNGELHSLQFNLNKNFKKKYKYNNQFDFIYNGGTLEHCFNQKNAFKNVHNLCKKNGYMMHVIPVHGGINHGFYNYNPYLLLKLAYTNSYVIEDIKFISDNNLNKDYKNLFDIHKLGGLEQDGYVLLIILFKKTNDDKFKLPYQLSDKYEFSIFNQLLGKTFITRIFHNYKNIAIFGTGDRGKIMTEFCNNNNFNVICYIDDYKIGSFHNKPIYNRDEFLDICKKRVDVVLYGPEQSGSSILNLPSSIKEIRF